jgi:hypothetical protein
MIQEKAPSDYNATSGDYEHYFSVPSPAVRPSRFLEWAQFVVGSIEKDLESSSLPRMERDALESGLARALECLLQEGQHERF